MICAFSAAFLGIDGYVARIEADASEGPTHFTIIGLPEQTLAEARERVRAAILNSGFVYPEGRLLVNISPADVRKTGLHFDLPIALALLGLNNQVDPVPIRNVVAIGELGPDGKVHPVKAVFSMVYAAANSGFTSVIVPRENAQEAALVAGVKVYPVDTLKGAVLAVAGTHSFVMQKNPPKVAAMDELFYGDFADVRGQVGAKRALEIAAAGNHNLCFIGPNGAGKTMLARRLPSIMPQMTLDEAMDVTKVYSLAGLLGNSPDIVQVRPFRFPHYTVSATALFGGGASVRPGEISLAHGGVIFLDEITEFSRSALENLRQPLEEGVVTIARAGGTFTFPARVLLIGSATPCPCGYRGTRSAECRCDDAAIAKHFARIPAQVMDRFDISVEVSRVPFDDMVRAERAERSKDIRARVVAARAMQKKRFEGTPITCNAEIPGAQVRSYASLGADAMEMVAKECSRRHISTRSVDRSIRIARTIADLDGSQAIQAEHIAEAMCLRALDQITAGVA